jgi:predicted RNA-binding Zn ribbon-like protein
MLVTKMTANHGFGTRVGGVLCLDFVNTVRARISNALGRGGRDDVDAIVGERLTSYDAVLSWGRFAELLTPRQVKRLAAEAERHPVRSATVLRRTITVREAMYRLFKGTIAGWPPRPDDLTVLNRELQIARAHERLTASPRGIVVDYGDPVSALDGMLWPIVRSARDLLTSSRLERVGQCPGDECGWLFLDTSRSGRRQWCDMKDCGNVAKVRRFREKARDDHEALVVKPRR